MDVRFVDGAALAKPIGKSAAKVAGVLVTAAASLVLANRNVLKLTDGGRLCTMIVDSVHRSALTAPRLVPTLA
jgi:hypothetical protein